MRCSIVVLLLCSFFVHEGYTDRVVISTHDQIGTNYQFFPLKTNNLQFSVKATNDIHVSLTNTPMLTGAYYEIVIGGWSNSKSAIRKDNGDHQVEYVGTIIKPNKFQMFSVTIDDHEGSIEVGKRHGDTFMYYKDPDYVKMSYFGISTGFGSKGEWNFDFDLFYCNCTRCS